LLQKIYAQILHQKEHIFPIRRTNKTCIEILWQLFTSFFFSGKNLLFFDKEIGKFWGIFFFSSANWNNFANFLFG
jgi:hypothetical protein